MRNIWAAEWHSKTLFDGEVTYLIHESCLPVLFRTRRECRAWIKERYGYILERPDLRREPHGWYQPRAVKVKIDKE